MYEKTSRPPVVRLAIAWTLVGLPLLWGVSQVVVRALALFEEAVRPA